MWGEGLLHFQSPAVIIVEQEQESGELVMQTSFGYVHMGRTPPPNHGFIKCKVSTTWSCRTDTIILMAWQSVVVSLLELLMKLITASMVSELVHELCLTYT